MKISNEIIKLKKKLIPLLDEIGGEFYLHEKLDYPYEHHADYVSISFELLIDGIW